MAPPPITPSPHRFLISQPSNSTPRPSSSLRLQQIATQSSSSQQFAAAPRFNFTSTQKPTSEHAAPATQYSSPLSRRPHLPPVLPAQGKEDIEETSSDREEDEQGNNDDSSLPPPTQPTSKRRRPTSSAPEAEAILISSSSSSSPPPTSTPTTPPHHTTFNPVPAFHPPTTQAPPHQPPHFFLPASSSINTPTIPTRPPLLLPPPPPSPAQPTTLPHIFSPHRRGQKYIPGGLASTVRDWIVEMGQMAHYNHARRAGGGEEGWEVRVRVMQCVVGGEGVVLVRGVDGGRWVLVGRGKGEGSVGVGRVIGVRGVVWEVEVGEGEDWRVGVEWGVLDG